jgi:uncharacterized repeat protein (TIGR02543 family)
MKNKICILLIPVLIMMMGLFSACEDAEHTIVRATTCTVTFDPNGGTFDDGKETLSVTVTRDTSLGSRYPSPTRDDYEFAGWFDAAGTRYKSSDPINATLTLTAKWMLVGGSVSVLYYTVTFNADGGPAVAPVNVVRGEPLAYKYPQIWRLGYWFNGWFIDPADNATEYTSTRAVNSAITLKAKWTAKEVFTVTFDAGKNDDGVSHYFEGTLSAKGTYSGGTNGKQTFTIEVYDGDGIWDKLPTTTGEMVGSTIVKKDPTKDVLYNVDSPNDNPLYYFWVQWIDEENRIYVDDVFLPITENTHLSPKWGAPDYSVPLRGDPPDPKTPAPTLVSIRDNGLPNGSNPVFRTRTVNGEPVYTIWNSTENTSTGRWQMMYWIELNLPENFNIKYYNKYSVDANFYGNYKATPAYTQNATMLPMEYRIPVAGQQMIPNRHGYGQISFCISTTGTGEAANEQTIFQQYNLGMGQDGDGGSVNSTWKPSNPGDAERDPAIPKVLLIQTSDDWIGRIEVTEIRFHNDPDFVGEKD